MTPFPPVEVTVYPYDCDAFGHLNQAAMLTLLERARWDALAGGPGMDLFDRNGVWPVVRKTTIEYQGPVYARDVLRVETVVAHRGTTSMTLRHTVRRISDEVQVAEAEMVFVCIDRLGRATPVPEEIARYLGPPPVRPGGGHQGLRVSVGDAELAVEVRGEGLPVVFVHGFPFDRTMWRHQLAALSRVRRIAFDLRGVGGSGAPPTVDGYSLGRYADDVIAVLDAVGVRDAVLCGLSMGGYVIFELLRRHPDRIKALILADTKVEPDSKEGKRDRDQLIAAVERHGADALTDRLLPRLLAPVTQTTQPEVAEQLQEMAQRWSVPALVGALRTLRDRPDSSDTLRSVRLPTLVLVGDDDAIAPPATALAMAKLVPDAQYHVVPAAGHLAPLEQPLATSRLVADFLGAIP
ncbi:MAG TPA: alpha/beta fold hydrolase [Gemmatimonadales bacterium]|nr:alpha/beta fold hydrolase [Gemmatimonadales bacterium]